MLYASVANNLILTCTVGGFILAAGGVAVKIFGDWRTKKIAHNAIRDSEIARKAVAEANGVDPVKLAADVKGLKIAVLGQEADEYGNGAVVGLNGRMAGVETTLHTLVDRFDQFAEANGGGRK